jgi:hypothetical protein
MMAFPERGANRFPCLAATDLSRAEGREGSASLHLIKPGTPLQLKHFASTGR